MTAVNGTALNGNVQLAAVNATFNRMLSRSYKSAPIDFFLVNGSEVVWNEDSGDKRFISTDLDACNDALTFDYGESWNDTLIKTPFDNVWYRAVLIVLYGLVCAGCIGGNLVVIVVILCNRKMRSVVNFCLANLAAADLSVGIFCVLPNLALYMSQPWLIGKMMCKLFYFVQSLAYSCSIIILTVISLERYVAINHPILSRRFSRTCAVRGFVMGGVWLISAAYSLPLFVAYDTIHVPVPTAGSNDGCRELPAAATEITSDASGGEEFCINKSLSNAHRIYVFVNFGLLYVAPLLLMTCVYARISVVLWHSGSTHSTTSSIISRKSNQQQQRRWPFPSQQQQPPPPQHSVAVALLRSAAGAGSLGAIGVPKRSGSLPGGGSFLTVAQGPPGEKNGDARRLSSTDYRRPTPNGLLTPTVGRFQRRATAAAECGLPMTSRTCVDLAAVAAAAAAAADYRLQGNHIHLPSESSKCVEVNGLRGENECIATGETATGIANKNRLHITPPGGCRAGGVGCSPANPLLSLSETQGMQRGSRVSLTPASTVSNWRSGSTVGSSQALPGQNPIAARRKVVRLLVAIVSSFAVCMLPHHVRLQWQEWSTDGHYSYEHMYIPPITTLIFYVNSCLNPLLYALISDRFRKAVSETRIIDWCRRCQAAATFYRSGRRYGSDRQRAPLPVPVIRNEFVSASCTA